MQPPGMAVYKSRLNNLGAQVSFEAHAMKFNLTITLNVAATISASTALLIALHHLGYL